MIKKRVCKRCRIFIEGNKCPICSGSEFTEGWKGRVIILNPSESEIAKKISINKEGTYAIKTR